MEDKLGNIQLIKLDDNIYYYTDLVDNTDEIVSYYKSAQDWDIRFGSKDENGNWIPDSPVNVETKSFKATELTKPLHDAFIKVLKHYLADNNMEFDPMNLADPIDEWPIDKHFPPTHLKTHSDTVPPYAKSSVTVLLYVNDDYEGGELSFSIVPQIENKGVINIDMINSELPVEGQGWDFYVRPKACSVVIMPADPPYFHAAHKITSGEKLLIKSFYVTETL